MTDLQAGTVTVADLYRELVGMRHDVTAALTRIEVIDAARPSLDKQLADHEQRMRALERFRFTVAGVSIIGGVGAGWIGYLLGHAIH